MSEASMRAILVDPATKPGHLFYYERFDPDATDHPYTDEPISDPWTDRFPPGRSVVMVMPRSRTGRVRFALVNPDTDDFDVWGGFANAARCIVRTEDTA